MTTLKEAQGFFAEDHFATENGAVIDEMARTTLSAPWHLLRITEMLPVGSWAACYLRWLTLPLPWPPTSVSLLLLRYPVKLPF